MRMRESEGRYRLVGYRDALASKNLLNETYIMGIIPINPEIDLNN